LLRLWGAIPAVLAGASSPPTNSFQNLPIVSRHSPYADWFISANFLRFASLLFLSRLGMIPISCFVGWITFLWARDLYGLRSGIVACSMYCFNPGALANGSLVTTDVGTAAAIVASCWLWWKFCRSPSWRGWLLALAAVLAAHLCKFTAALVWPMLLAMTLPFGPWRRRGFLPAAWLGLGIATLFLINAVYGFRGTAKPFGSLPFMSDYMIHIQKSVPSWLPSPLPERYIVGFDAQKFDSGLGYEGFLFGEIYRGARWYFFPIAILCKTPVGLLLLIPLAIFSVIPRRPQPVEESILLAIGVFAAGVIVLGDLNIGTRYLLPMFPLAFVLISRIWSVDLKAVSKGRSLLPNLATGLLLVSIFETLWVCPRFLTFMNSAVGGTSNGWRVLNNADFDWGQGLTDLRHWMQENDVPTVQFAYFGFVDPKVYGVQSTPFIDKSDAQFFAISSYFLDGLQHRILVDKFKRRWIELNFYRQLQQKKPIAVVGNTIFIYSRVEVESAVNEYFTSGNR
jgi:4-amino-4-deoxy-L-arabinose transferase-like glycosyltransferase